MSRDPLHAALQSLGSAAVPGARRRPVRRDPGRRPRWSPTKLTRSPRGHRLKSGTELEADIIVTATGLMLQVLGGMKLRRRRAVEFAQDAEYKGTMYSGVPNLASTFGYTKASWTLKCDLTANMCAGCSTTWTSTATSSACRTVSITTITEVPRSISPRATCSARSRIPKQGQRPWRLHQNYALDLVALRSGKIDDGVIQYS